MKEKFQNNNMYVTFTKSNIEIKQQQLKSTKTYTTQKAVEYNSCSEIDNNQTYLFIVP